MSWRKQYQGAESNLRHEILQGKESDPTVIPLLAALAFTVLLFGSLLVRDSGRRGLVAGDASWEEQRGLAPTAALQKKGTKFQLAQNFAQQKVMQTRSAVGNNRVGLGEDAPNIVPVSPTKSAQPSHDTGASGSSIDATLAEEAPNITPLELGAQPMAAPLPKDGALGEDAPNIAPVADKVSSGSHR